MKKVNTSDRLKEIMNLWNLKQIDILKRCEPYCIEYNEKINKSHLSQWIAGINEPNNRKLKILAIALNVSEVWLMGYDVPMRNEPEFSTPELDADISNDSEFKELYKKFIMLTDEQKKAVSVMIDTFIKTNEGE